MREILFHPIFRRLFAAQVVALLGTGLLTIALGLLAFDIAGENAGQVLGLALTIKMIAYVGVAPLMSAALAKMNRRHVMVAADIARLLVALTLPFIDAAWQIYVLIFVLQAASATFTPTFQAVIPDILPDESEYTKALSLSRLAYDLENILSPMLAAVLLSFLAPSLLFMGTALGFLVSALVILNTALPARPTNTDRPFMERVTHGTRIYLATPRLRGLLALNVTVSAVSAVVIVQSVVIARGIYGGSAQSLALLLGAYGLGSMLVAFVLPQLLDRVSDRRVMLFAGSVLSTMMLVFGAITLLFGWPNLFGLLVVWVLIGGANTAVITPSGRLLRRSAHAEDRPAVFTAQFALSHSCWLFAYPAAGFLGTWIGLHWTMIVLGLIGIAGVVAARTLWPNAGEQQLLHSHNDLPPEHPHLKDAIRKGDKWVHRHRFVIDDEHRVWPTSG